MCVLCYDVVRVHTAAGVVIRDADVFLSLIQIIGKVPSTRGGWLTWREAVRALCSAVECARSVERSLSTAAYLAFVQFAPGLIKYLVG